MNKETIDLLIDNGFKKTEYIKGRKDLVFTKNYKSSFDKTVRVEFYFFVELNRLHCMHDVIEGNIVDGIKYIFKHNKLDINDEDVKDIVNGLNTLFN